MTGVTDDALRCVVEAPVLQQSCLSTGVNVKPPAQADSHPLPRHLSLKGEGVLASSLRVCHASLPALLCHLPVADDDVDFALVFEVTTQAFG